MPSVNEWLRSKLWRDLNAGSRVVAHDYDLGDWKPEREARFEEYSLVFWTITPDLKNAGKQ